AAPADSPPAAAPDSVLARHLASLPVAAGPGWDRPLCPGFADLAIALVARVAAEWNSRGLVARPPPAVERLALTAQEHSRRGRGATTGSRFPLFARGAIAAR